jgi:hypothetical protein
VVVGSVVSFTLLHHAGLSVMAHGGIDAYALYGYSTICLLLALAMSAASGWVATRFGDGAAAFASFAAIALTLFVHRPAATSWGTSAVAALAHDRAGAACGWRFAEGFGREHRHGVATTGRSRDEHVIARCRSLSEEELVADCIGGIARELSWRHGGHVDGAPPASLTNVERRAYAYLYGTHRDGDATDCADFESADLEATCVSAVRLECLVYGDIYTRMATGRPLGRASCAIAPPPVDGYWAARHRDIFGRAPGAGVDTSLVRGDDDASRCEPTFTECYAE